MTERTIVIGGGPAGLTAAWELARAGGSSLVLEADSVVGGISRTASYEGYRFDVGGHRFFTKVPHVQQVWEELIGDEFLVRPRLSRIFYRGRMFDYPLKPANAVLGLGPVETVRIGLSYLKAQLFPSREERTFEQWVSNRFGRRLFEIFFKTYTEKVWGMPCSEISAEWAAQRIKDLDLKVAIKQALFGGLGSRGKVVTSLIEEFHYPRLGPGQMWERCADKLGARGSEVRLGTRVVRIEHDGRRVLAVHTRSKAGDEERHEGASFLSSMPLQQLFEVLDPAPPAEVLAAAARLRYRDFLTVALIVDEPELFPDNWIYIHEPDVQVGRIQNYTNWSPDMVPDPSRTALGLEYFVQEGDALWTTPDDELRALATREVEHLGLVPRGRVLDGTVLRMPKAYPVYDAVYKEALEVLRGWLAGLENLESVGRNGQHRYNNQDHSMMTGAHAAWNLGGGEFDVWGVNVEQEYHEKGQSSSVSGDRAVPSRVAPVGAKGDG